MRALNAKEIELVSGGTSSSDGSDGQYDMYYIDYGPSSGTWQSGSVTQNNSVLIGRSGANSTAQLQAMAAQLAQQWPGHTYACEIFTYRDSNGTTHDTTVCHITS